MKVSGKINEQTNSRQTDRPIYRRDPWECDTKCTTVLERLIQDG